MDKILKNTTIVITRAEEQARSFAGQIKKLGAKPLFFPTIVIESINDFTAFDAALTKIKSYDWLIFTSTNSARFFCLQARKLNIEIRPKNIAVIGQKTADHLKEFGIDIFMVPEVPTANGLLNVFSKLNMRDKKILIPGSDISQSVLPDGLTKMGAMVESLIVYENKTNTNLDTNKLSNLIKSGKIDFITFFSPSAFTSFIDLLGKSIVAEIIYNKIALAVIGPTTAQAIKKLNITPAVQSLKSTEEDLLQGIVNFKSKFHHGVSVNV
jgi:uroporphyrinogen-III synthase